ncbi:MAG TPA: MgtC/SapB family protein [Gammaproteobacteria bacterium]|nr:MgtC/SapB family protein [Gammaproteobacteria bacterium]
MRGILLPINCMGFIFSMVETKQIFLLGVALAIGLIIGMERGWHAREIKEGERIAGLRTFALIGLLGGCSGLLTQALGPLVLSIAFLGFSGVVGAGFLLMHRQQNDLGITSLVAALLTFMLGAMAIILPYAIAAPIAVVVALILRAKPYLHGWLLKLEKQELHAVIQLLLISVVLLSLLPNKGYGPWGFFNPFKIWWMVVAVALISFIGYFAMKIGGAKKGILFTALFAGLAHSTIVTYNFSRLMSKDQSNISRLLAAGILLACSIMYPRILLLATLINPKIFIPLSLPILIMTVLNFIPALLMTGGVLKGSYQETPLPNPMEIKPAIVFGVILTLVMFLSRAVKEYSGDLGIYILALVSGFVDVDAINLSLSQMSLRSLSQEVAVTGIVIGAFANNFFKSVLAVSLGQPKKIVLIWVCLPLLLSAGIGLGVVWLSFHSV